MGPKVLKTHKKKVRKVGEDRKPNRFVHKTFAQQVADVSVSVSHLPELGHDVGRDGDLKASHLQDALAEWRGINRSQDFDDFTKRLRPLCRTMPMIMFNLDRIVPIVLENLKNAESLGIEPVLGVLAALSRDARHELTPHFHDIFTALVDLLETCLQNAPVLEKIFQCMSFLFKYLVKYITKNLAPYAETYGRLLCHTKHYIRQFAGESFAFLLRKANTKEGLNILFKQLDEADEAKMPLVADSISVVIYEACKSIQLGFHSKLEDFLKVLFTSSNLTKSEARRRVAKASFIRLRNHADEMEKMRPLLDIFYDHWRAAVARRTGAELSEDENEDGSSSGSESAPEEQQSTDKPKEQESTDQQDLFQDHQDVEMAEQSNTDASESDPNIEVRFYLDCMIAFVAVYPRPYAEEEDAFDEHASEMLEGVSKLLEMVKKNEEEDNDDLVKVIGRVVCKLAEELPKTSARSPAIGEVVTSILESEGNVSASFLYEAVQQPVLLNNHSTVLSAAVIRLLQTEQSYHTVMLKTCRALKLMPVSNNEKDVSLIKKALVEVLSLAALDQDAATKQTRGGEDHEATNTEMAVAATLALHKICTTNLDEEQVQTVCMVIASMDNVLSKLDEKDRGLVGARACLSSIACRSMGTNFAVKGAFIWALDHFDVSFVIDMLKELVTVVDQKVLLDKIVFDDKTQISLAKELIKACTRPDQAVRLAAFQLVRALPNGFARLHVPSPAEFSTIRPDDITKPDKLLQEDGRLALDSILLTAEQLEDFAPTFDNERPKQNCIDKIGRFTAKYQTLNCPLNVGTVMAIAAITSQFTVKFNTLWKPSLEQLVLISSTSGYRTGTSASSGQKRKADKAELEAKKKKKRKQAKAQRAREENLWSDESDDEDYLATSASLALEKNDVWVELVWCMATTRLNAIQELCESQITETEVEGGRKKGKQGIVYESKKKVLDMRFVELEHHGDQLSQSVDEERDAFTTMWSTLDGSFNAESVDYIRENLWFWKTLSGVLKSTVWNMDNTAADCGSDVDELGATRTRWIVGRFLELFEKKRSDAYTRALTARVVQSLEVVAEVPSFDRFCPRSMVRRIMQTCSTWMLMDPEIDIQKLAIKVLMHCGDLSPAISPYRLNIEGIIGEKDFRDSMLRLSLQPDAGLIKEEHRERIVPIILRLLFSKLIKKSKKLDKKGNQKHSRRAAVFAAFASLKQEELHHLLAVMLHGVLSFRRVEDSSSVTSGKKVGDIPRARVLTQFLKQVCMRKSEHKIDRVWSEDQTEEGVPTGFAHVWTVETNGESKTLAVSLEDTARVRRLLGFLGSAKELTMNMSETIYPVCELLMSLFITMLQRSPAAILAQSLEDKLEVEKVEGEDDEEEKKEDEEENKTEEDLTAMMGASSHRALVRETIRRMTDITTKFPTPKGSDSWEVILTPMKPTVDFFVSRLPQTAGSVQMSAVVNMLIQWSFHPELLDLFKLFPQAVPTLLSLFSAPAVLKEARTIKKADACTQQRRRKEAKKQGRKALIKFDKHVETPSAGPVVEAVMDMIMRLSKGGGAEIKDLKKREKKYKDIRRDKQRKARRRGDSSDEEEQNVVKKNDDFIEQEIQEKWLADGLALVQPHADLMLHHIAILIQHRKDNCPEVPIATMKELDLLETIALWADSRECVLNLTKLLCMALLHRPKAKTNLRTSKQLAALVSLVPRACFVENGDMSKVDDAAKDIILLPRQLEKLLPHVQHLGSRKQICEVILLSEMALRGLDAKSMVEKLQTKMDHNEHWQPSKNVIVDEKTYTEVHVAHMMLALNALKGTLAVTDPDTDAHVAMLESFSDECALGDKKLPASLVGPVLSHLLFLVSCGEIDFAVRNAAERALTSLADRCAEEPELLLTPKDDDKFVNDTSHMFYLIIRKVVPGLRQNLKSESDDVQRSNLKVLSHYTRILAPLLPEQEDMSEDLFGNSPMGLLHADLLPYLRKNSQAVGSLDEGGDLFHEFLHLQKHRRGRAALRASKLTVKGKLSRPTIVHIIQPLCVSMILQLTSSKPNFDSNLAETALRCLGAVCQSVKWSTILNTLRYLSGVLMRRKDRENIVVKTICHVLQSYRYSCPDATKSTSSAEAVMEAVDKHRNVQDDEEGLFPGEKSASDVKKKEDAKVEKAAEEDTDNVTQEEIDAEIADAERQRDIVARSVKSTVLPILRKILWQKDKEEIDRRAVHVESQGGRKRKREPQGTIRVGVVSVLLHVLRYLPAEEFHGQLPRLVHVLTEGLLSRDAGQRRAARFAASHVVTALGSPYLPWLIREMKPRMTRGYAIPVLMMTAHTCLEELIGDELCMQAPTLQQDLNTAMIQLMPLVEAEVERLCDPSRLDNDADERLPNQVNESKAIRGPVMLRTLSKYADPQTVQVQVVQTLYGWLLKDRTTTHENWGQVSTNATSLKFLRRVEELIKNAIDGLLVNEGFDISHHVAVMERLLTLTAQLLNPKKFGQANDEALFKAAAKTRADIEPEIGAKGWVAPKKEKFMSVQAGAAEGRGAWHGVKKPKSQTGFDGHIRAKVLGVAGLRVLLKTMRHEQMETITEKLSSEIIPLVTQCFVSSQDALFVQSSKCLHRMLVIFKEKPEVFENHAERIAVTVLNVFRRAAAQQQLSGRLQRMAAARGLGVPGGSEIIGTCTRTLATLLRKRVSSDWFNKVHDKQLAEIEDVDHSIAKSALKSTFMEALIGQIHASLDHEGLKASSLLLLSRVLLHQKVELPSIYECVDRVGEVLIRGGDTVTSKRCAQIYTEFMMNYPHEDKALQNKLTFLVRNLGFNEAGGRRSVINALYMVIMQFPIDLLTKRFGALIFVPVVARLPQETDDQARKMLEVLLLALFERVDKATRNQLFALALRWKNADKPVLKIALADLLSLVPRIEGEKPVERFQEFVPILREMLPEDDSILEGGEQGPATAPAPKDAIHWRLVYSIMRSFEKFACSVTPQELDRLSNAKTSPCASVVCSFWNDLIGHAIESHPHPWVRAVALRTLQQYLTERDASVLKPGKHTLMASGDVLPFATLRSLCSIFASDDLEKHPDLVAPLMRTTLGMVQLALGAPWLAGMSNENSSANKAEKELENQMDKLVEVAVPESSEQEIEVEYEQDTEMADVGQDVEQEKDSSDKEEDEAPAVFDPETLQPSASSDKDEEEDDAEQEKDKDEEEEPVLPQDEQEKQANLEEDLKPSLFEKFVDADSKQDDGLRVFVDGPAKKQPTKQQIEDSKVSIAAAAEDLHKCRVKYAVVRLSYIARKFLAAPEKHVVTLASIFRLFGAMASELSPQQVEALIDPFVAPLYRSLSLANKESPVQVGDITTTQQLLHLTANERREVLASLSQQALNVIESHCTSSSAAYSQALTRARTVTAGKRRDRAVKLRQDKIARPEVAAMRKIKKHQKAKDRRKRNQDEVVLRTKGGYDGSMKRVAKAMKKLDKWD